MKAKKKAKYNEITGLPYLPEDLSMRLGRSLVRYQDKPVYIVDSGVTHKGYYLNAHDILTGADLIIRLPDTQLDVRPVPLGYVNLDNKAVYVSRRPHRRYKQGLCAESLIVERGGLMNVRGLITSKALADCIMNNYPSFDDALARVKQTQGSCAFARRFALSTDRSGVIFLEYRGERVGHFPGELQLGESHSYLKEELETVYANP